MINVSFLILFLLIISCRENFSQDYKKDISSDKKKNSLENSNDMAKNPKVTKSDTEWKKDLSPDQYRILRQKETEAPFTGKFYKNNETGVYICAGCGNELFKSDTKYDSGCGWPSFFDSISKEKIKTKTDNSHGMLRIEIMCARCDGHLGHVFDDGPAPTGVRYCVNSLSLDFKKEEH